MCSCGILAADCYRADRQRSCRRRGADTRKEGHSLPRGRSGEGGLYGQVPATSRRDCRLRARTRAVTRAAAIAGAPAMARSTGERRPCDALHPRLLWAITNRFPISACVVGVPTNTKLIATSRLRAFRAAPVGVRGWARDAGAQEVSAQKAYTLCRRSGCYHDGRAIATVPCTQTQPKNRDVRRVVWRPERSWSAGRPRCLPQVPPTAPQSGSR